MNRAALLLPALVLSPAAAARDERREPDVVVPATRPRRPRGARPPRAASDRDRADRLRHPRPGLDEFWTVVQRGNEEAQRQIGAAVSYRAPDRSRSRRMRRYIDEAVADRARRPRRLAARRPRSRRRSARPRSRPASRSSRSTPAATSSARSACSPTSASPSRRRASRRASGWRRAGVRRALCVNQENGNAGPRPALPPASRDGLREGRRALAPLRGRRYQDRDAAQQRIASASTPPASTGSSRWAPAAREPALDAVARRRAATLATFDLSPDVLARGARRPDAVRGRPAALPAGLPAGDAARRAGALRRLPGRGRADPDRPELRHQPDRRAGRSGSARRASADARGCPAW